LKLTLKEMIDAKLLAQLLEDFYVRFKISISIQDIYGDVIAFSEGQISSDINFQSKKTTNVPLYINNIAVANIVYKQFIENKLSDEDINHISNNLVTIINGFIEKYNVHLDLKIGMLNYTKLISFMTQGTIILKSLNNKINIDSDYFIVDVNDAFEIITNIKKDVLVGKKLSNVEDKFKKTGNSIRSIINSKGQNNFEYYYKEVNKLLYFEVCNFSEDEIAIIITDATKKYEDRLYLNKKQIMNTVIAIGDMVEKRDLYTSRHQKKVAYLASKIAEEIGLCKEQVESIYVSGLLHDIGKIGIPSEILTKPDKLSNLEFEIIKSHVNIAYDILCKIEFPWPISKIVLQHHEKINGTGYPNGLKEEEILLEAKILSVADVVEAITSHRPYRQALGIAYAINEITNCAGVYYDPKVVDACVRVCSKDKWNSILEEACSDNIINKFSTK